MPVQLFILYMIQNGSFSTAWQQVGAGIRDCVDLGIHQRIAVLRFRNVALAELYSKAFWSFVMWDRVISCLLGRPVTFGRAKSVFVTRIAPCTTITDVGCNSFDLDYLEEVDDEYWTSNAIGSQSNRRLSKITAFNVMVNCAEILEDLVAGKVGSSDHSPANRTC